MKILGILLIFLLSNAAAFANCTIPDGFDADSDISSLLQNCKVDSALDIESGDYTLEWGFKEKIESIVSNGLIIAGGLVAMMGIIYSAFLLLFSTGEDDKVKKAKDGFLWAILWFIVTLLSSSIVNAVSNIFYEIFG